MRRYKFENLLKSFLINRLQYCVSIIDGKKGDVEVEVENLLIAILISKQQTKCHLKICQSVLFTTKNCQSVFFSLFFIKKVEVARRFECECVVHPFQNGFFTLLDKTGSHPENGTRSKISVALRPRFVPESGPSSLCEPTHI